MKDNLDEILSGAFQDKHILKSDTEFTAGVMRELPRQGLPLITRTAIICLFVGMSLVPVLGTDYADLYAEGEDIVNESYVAAEYYLEELLYSV